MDYFFEEHGIESFKNGTIIADSGHLTAFYNDDEMHDIVTAKLIERNFEERIMNKLSYISLSKVPKKEIEQIESLILEMNDKEREIYFDKLSIMEFRLRDEEYLRSSFGIGDKMSRKLIINSSINPNKKGA